MPWIPSTFVQRIQGIGGACGIDDAATCVHAQPARAGLTSASEYCDTRGVRRRPGSLFRPARSTPQKITGIRQRSAIHLEIIAECLAWRGLRQIERFM